MYKLEVKTPTMRKWKTLSVTKKVPFSDVELVNHQYQYAADRQINPNTVEIRCVKHITYKEARSLFNEAIKQAEHLPPSNSYPLVKHDPMTSEDIAAIRVNLPKTRLNEAS